MELTGRLLGVLFGLGTPLTSRSSSVKWEPLDRQGRQCVGKPVGPAPGKCSAHEARHGARSWEGRSHPGSMRGFIPPSHSGETLCV